MFLIRTEVPFIQEVSGECTLPSLDTDELNMALRAQKGFRGFRETGPLSVSLGYYSLGAMAN